MTTKGKSQNPKESKDNIVKCNCIKSRDLNLCLWKKSKMTGRNHNEQLRLYWQNNRNKIQSTAKKVGHQKIILSGQAQLKQLMTSIYIFSFFNWFPPPLKCLFGSIVQQEEVFPTTTFPSAKTACSSIWKDSQGVGGGDKISWSHLVTAFLNCFKKLLMSVGQTPGHHITSSVAQCFRQTEQWHKTNVPPQGSSVWTKLTM